MILKKKVQGRKKCWKVSWHCGRVCKQMVARTLCNVRATVQKKDGRKVTSIREVETDAKLQKLIACYWLTRRSLRFCEKHVAHLVLILIGQFGILSSSFYYICSTCVAEIHRQIIGQQSCNTHLTHWIQHTALRIGGGGGRRLRGQFSEKL